jgi:hypothetical protein
MQSIVGDCRPAVHERQLPGGSKGRSCCAFACMHGACGDILGARVRIPVSVNVYDAISGCRDPRADQIDDMLQGLLSGRQVKAPLRSLVEDG